MTVPGSVDVVAYRSQDPDGAYGTPMLSLRSGRFPTGTEVALTDAVADDQQMAIGDTLDLDGTARSVVGVVENPADLGDEFVLVAPADPAATSHAVLVQSPDEKVRELPASVPVAIVRARGSDETTVAAVAALGVAVVVAILVCLVAAAGFVVIAQRRLRQLGMLAAIGATERHLRLVVVANGVVVGTVAAVVGAVLSITAWLATSPLLESAAGHRLHRYDLPWWIVVAAMALALATATAAAWWPGRTLSRVPITMALSARPPQPRSVHRSAVMALGLVVLGALGLAAGIDNTSEEANALVVLPAIAASVAGMLLLSPLAIRALRPLGRRAPIAVRLAVRDVVRYQARSSVALAAITLSLGLAVTTVIVAGAAKDAPDSGNLSDQQVLVRIGTSEPLLPTLSDDTIEARRVEVEELGRTLGATLVPLTVAISPGARETLAGVEHHPIVVLGRRIPNGFRDAGFLYVATPELAAHLGIDLAGVDGSVDVLTPKEGDLGFANVPIEKAADGGRVEDPPLVVQAVDVPDYSEAPTSLLTPASVARNGWQAAPAGWLLETDQPLTAAQYRGGSRHGRTRRVRHRGPRRAGGPGQRAHGRHPRGHGHGARHPRHDRGHPPGGGEPRGPDPRGDGRLVGDPSHDRGRHRRRPRPVGRDDRDRRRVPGADRGLPGRPRTAHRRAAGPPRSGGRWRTAPGQPRPVGCSPAATSHRPDSPWSSQRAPA